MSKLSCWARPPERKIYMQAFALVGVVPHPNAAVADRKPAW